MVKLKMLGTLATLQTERDSEGYMNISCDNKTLGELIAKMPMEETGIKYSALLNNRVVSPGTLLKDGDIVMIMPLMAGG